MQVKKTPHLLHNKIINIRKYLSKIGRLMDDTGTLIGSDERVGQHTEGVPFLPHMGKVGEKRMIQFSLELLSRELKGGSNKNKTGRIRENIIRCCSLFLPAQRYKPLRI